jgi:hypothetical protein
MRRDRLRALFVICAITLSGGVTGLTGCGDAFTASTDGGTGGTSTTGGTAGSAGTGATGGTGAAGGTGSAGGGTSSSTCDDVDHDGDGTSSCTGDCDDQNPFVHPGALEICGDGVDEDCDGKDNLGEECAGYSVYVSQLKGSVGAKGTMDDPVATIAEGVSHAQLLGGQAAVLVAAGSYAEDVTVVGKISLVGGYDPGDWAKRDPKTQVTSIKSPTETGLKLVGVDEQMIVDGFSIFGRAVQSGAASSAAVTIDGGGPVLSNDVISGGTVADGGGSSVGVRILENSGPAHKPRLWVDVITAGPDASGPTYGVVVDAKSAEVSLVGDVITAGKGTNSVGLLVSAAKSVVVFKTALQSDVATGDNSTPSASLGAWVKTGELLFDSNLVNADQLNSPPRCFTPDVWCGGLRVSTGAATIVNNVIFGSASDRSAGIHLLEEDDSLADVVVSSNTLVGSGHLDAETVSAAVLLGSPKVDAVVTEVGRFRNNVLYGGFATFNYAFYEQQIMGESCDPAALDHNLFFFPVNAPNEGILYGNWDGGSQINIKDVDKLPGLGSNIAADPKITKGHIGTDSPCRNTGTDKDAPDHDVDGDSRPQEGKFDIGPDELVAQ